MSDSTSNVIIAHWGDVNSIAAELFMQAYDPSINILSGQVSGPFCSLAHTLSSRHDLVSCGEKGKKFFKVVLPDPCFWSPGAPYLYKADIEICVDSKQKLSHSLTLGIRPLTIRGHSFFYAGRRHVMRIVDVPQLVDKTKNQELVLDACLDTGAVLLVRDLQESMCEQATDKGVLLAVKIANTNPKHVLSELEKYACWPAVGLAILPKDLILDTVLPPSISSLIRAVEYQSGENIPPWAQVLISNQSMLEKDMPEEKKRPQMVCCSVDPGESVNAARRACDDLQRRTVAWPQLAGYIASPSVALY